MKEKLVTVYKTFNLSELAIAKSLLTDAGIKFVVQNENFGSLYSGFYNLTGFIEIQVYPDLAEQAEKLLSDLHNN